jgi:hypothetical protein
MPLLIQYSKNKDLESRFAKVNNVLIQTVKRAEATEGNFTHWSWDTSDNLFFTYFTPYLTVLNVCKPNETGCGNETEYKYLDGRSATNPFPTNLTRFTTLDGAKWLIGVNANCIGNQEYCALIRVDVNGDDEPNMYGRDVFTFFMLPFTNEIKVEGLYEYPTSYNSSTGWLAYTKQEIEDDCNIQNGGGTLCGAKIILDGFKMKY